MPSALARIQFRYGTASDWTAANPVLLAGEPGMEVDTAKVKVGDGVRRWVALPYMGSSSGGSTPVTSVNSKTGDVILIPEDVPGLSAFIKSVIAATLVAGPNVGITSNSALGTVTIAAAGSGGGGGGGVISINGKAGGVTLDGRDGITVAQETSVPTIHIGVNTGGSYGGGPALPTAPAGVVGVPGDGRVVVGWQEPSSSGSSAIVDYVVQYSVDFGATWSVFADGQAAALSSTVTGLTNGQDYVFRVAAVSSTGQGAFSAASPAVRPFAPSSTLTGVTLSGSAVQSGDPSGTVVGTLAPVPPSITGVTYSLPATTPGNASFSIAGNQLKVAAVLDDSTAPTVLVSVKATPTSGSPVNADFTITVTPSPATATNTLSISRQPASAVASSGSASFSVEAVSSLSLPVLYQWQSKPAGSASWANMPGATSASLSLSGLTYSGNNATRYRVVVSSAGADDVVSAEACLGVQPSGWTRGSAVNGAIKVFPVNDGVMAMTRTALYWTADGSAHQDRTPQFVQSPYALVGHYNDIEAFGWAGIGVKAGAAINCYSPNVGMKCVPSTPALYRVGNVSGRVNAWFYSSDSGNSWAGSTRAGAAGGADAVVGAAGWADQPHISPVAPGGPYAWHVSFSANGLSWTQLPRLTATAPFPDSPSLIVPGFSGTTVVTATRVLVVTAGKIFHRPASDLTGAWSAYNVTAPQTAAGLPTSRVLEVAGQLWWFGWPDKYYSCALNCTDWQEHPLPFVDRYVGFAYGSGTVVAIGSGRAAVCSDTSSHAWTAEPLGLTNPIGVAYANSRFFVYSSTLSAVREVIPAGGVVGCNIPGVVPSAPQQLSAVSGDGTVELSWVQPASEGTSPVVSYAVQYRASPSGAWSTAQVVSGTAATVSGRSNGTAYDFRVSASNSDGAGAFATATATPHGPPAQAPTNVTAVGTTPNVTALNSTLTALSVNGGYAWRTGDHTRFSVSWDAPGSGPTPLRYIVEMRSLRLGKTSGFPWQPAGFASPMFDVTYSGTTAEIRPLYNIYSSYSSATLWNRNLLWSFRTAAVTGDGPGDWSVWSAPVALMPAGTDATVPVIPVLPLPPAPVVAAGAIGTYKACFPYAGGTQEVWWDVVTLSWPDTGSTVTGVQVQDYHAAGTVLGVSYAAGWAPYTQISGLPETVAAYTDASVAIRNLRSFRIVSATSVELYLLRGASPCNQVAPPATSAYAAAYGNTRDHVRVILETAAGNSPGGEVIIPVP